MGTLILSRHGQSQFNAKSLWTGNWDVPLTDEGRRDAELVARKIKDIKPALAFTSDLSRAKNTLEIILATNKWAHVPVRTAAELNERDYGDLTGMNKWAVEERYGEKQFTNWRRGWDEPVPKGETLKDVSRRAIPYFEHHILPEVRHGHNVLLVSHSNVLRTIVKALDELTDSQVGNLEIPIGQILIYTLDGHGTVKDKITRQIEIDPKTT